MTTPTATTRFAIVPEWVLLSASANAVKLYCLLDRRGGRSGECWPKRAGLAERMDVSTDTVDRAKRELQDLGALVIEPRFRADGGRSTNTYFLRRDPPIRMGAEYPPLGMGAEGAIRTGAEGKKNESQKEREQNKELQALVPIHENGATHDPVGFVYAYWRTCRQKTRSNYDRISPSRRQKIETRLREFSVEDLCAAIDGVGRDPWAERHLHDDITVIFRSQEQVERFLDMRAAVVAPGRVTAAGVIARAQESRRRELGQIPS